MARINHCLQMIMIADMGIEKTHYVWQTPNKKKHDVCIIIAMTTSKRKKDNASSIYAH